MSARTFNSMSVDDLIDEYARLARSLGSLWSRQCKPAENTPECVEMNEELRAIEAELRARKPIEALRPLFDHENVDVRFNAAWSLLQGLARLSTAPANRPYRPAEASRAAGPREGAAKACGAVSRKARRIGSSALSLGASAWG